MRCYAYCPERRGDRLSPSAGVQDGENEIPVQSVLASVDQATGAARPTGPSNFSVFVQAGAGGSVGGTIQGVDVFSLYLGARGLTWHEHSRRRRLLRIVSHTDRSRPIAGKQLPGQDLAAARHGTRAGLRRVPGRTAIGEGWNGPALSRGAQTAAALGGGPAVSGTGLHGTPRPGSSASTILSEASRLGAGVIVIGSHGKGPVHRLLVGSTSEGVLRGSTVPVFVVPTRRKA